jgi:hypothetical protein
MRIWSILIPSYTPKDSIEIGFIFFQLVLYFLRNFEIYMNFWNYKRKWKMENSTSRSRPKASGPSPDPAMKLVWTAQAGAACTACSLARSQWHGWPGLADGQGGVGKATRAPVQRGGGVGHCRGEPNSLEKVIDGEAARWQRDGDAPTTRSSHYGLQWLEVLLQLRACERDVRGGSNWRSTERW